jgi:hypothetical protein
MPSKTYIKFFCCVLLFFTACERSVTTQSSTTSSTQPPTAVQAVSPTTAAAAVDQPQAAKGMSSDTSGANSATDKPKFDACTLLTKAEVESVQGDAVKETKSDGRSDGGMSVSQCFYSVTSFSKSVSLAVTQSDTQSNTKNGPKDFWTRTFHRDDEKDREREKERERERERDRDRDKKGEKESEQSRGKGEEEEEGTPPRKITGVGDEAYWMGSRVGGALYVLKKNAFIRISVGGPGNEEEKINKSKTLAQKALKRL